MTPRPRRLADASQERAADIALVRAVQRREPGSGERLYDCLIAAVDRTIARVLGRSAPEHDDLVQATFEQLVTTLMDGTFRHECSLKSWTASIGSHLALNAIRTRYRERAIFDRGRSAYDEDRAAARECTERSVETKRTLAQLRVELSAMNQERARAVVLFHVLEYDLKQVASVLGISVAAAQSRVVRGRRELLQRLHGRTGEDDGC
jgi:RNA polymerase sigma-70 factor (ECF subfamily)